MNNFGKKDLILFLNIIIALIIIIYTLYRRVFLIRLPKDLYLITIYGVNISLAILVVVSIFVMLYLLYHNIKLLLEKESQENIFSSILLKLNDIIENALQQFYEFVVNLLFSNIYDKVSYLVQKFYKYFKDISEAFFLFILYFIRLAILFCFLWDVFACFRLNYFYHALYLLCFSLLIKMLFYIIKDFSGNVEELKSMLIIEDLGYDAKTNLPRTRYKFVEENNDLNLEYVVGQFILCNKITGYLENYNKYSHFFTCRLNIFIYSAYLLGWISHKKSYLFINLFIIRTIKSNDYIITL